MKVKSIKEMAQLKNESSLLEEEYAYALSVLEGTDQMKNINDSLTLMRIR